MCVCVCVCVCVVYVHPYQVCSQRQVQEALTCLSSF